LKENKIINDQEQLLWVLLNQTYSAMQVMRRRELKTLRVSMTETAVLSLMSSNNGNATPYEISRWIFRESQSVSGLLDRMEKKGLLARVEDAKRLHGTRVVLTDKGRELGRKLATLRGVRKMIGAVFSPEELEQLTSYLMRLRGRALKETSMDVRIPLPIPLLRPSGPGSRSDSPVKQD
jgi:DNA-binding MarR family transcriptional regulator